MVQVKVDFCKDVLEKKKAVFKTLTAFVYNVVYVKFIGVGNGA